MARVAVIGAGIAGLAAAYRLRQAGHAVVVYDAADRVGGVIASERRDGFLVELGPTSIVAPPPRMSELIAELGLDAHRVNAAADAATRFVVRDGELVRLPMTPTQLLTSGLLSNAGKLAIFGEAFHEAVEPPVEESVAGFVRRRFNAEILEYVVDPFVAGVFAGDPEHLSMRHAFPTVHAMEAGHGSVMKALMQGRKERRRAAGASSSDLAASPLVPLPLSFRDGLAALPAAFAAALGDAVRLGSPVAEVQRDGAAWSVAPKFGEAASYDGVVYAAPAYGVDDIAFVINGSERVQGLTSIEYPAVALVALGFRRDAIAHPLDGFGFLVPEVERRHVLGVLFSSSVFPDRAPEGQVLLTAFVGGARDPQFAEYETHTLTARVLDDLRGLLGVRGEPVFRMHHLWPQAIPQYVLGYGRFKELMDELERKNPGLVFAGSYREGVSLGDTLLSGDRAALRLVEAFAGAG